MIRKLNPIRPGPVIGTKIVVEPMPGWPSLGLRRPWHFRGVDKIASQARGNSAIKGQGGSQKSFYRDPEVGFLLEWTVNT